ncbi:MAG TPA: M20/M25/M40 family metallo-hydrolase, partial [Thermoplasmatales archaeon]|nr:M20/M25/M40 family metallo-hydrolase [Thermoplasmatales archaeon]
VETSTNLATVRLGEELTVEMSTRSSIDSALEGVMQRIRAIGELAGATIEEGGRYPGWKPDMGSELLDVAKRAYRDIHGEDPEIKAIHAGLEPGVIGQVVDADMISIGPQIEHPHSPDEVVYVSSVQKFWDYLLNILCMVAEQKE